MKFKIPLQSEIAVYMKEKKGWPDQFCKHYSEKFWNHYTASGWKLSSGNAIKDWKACFNAQWQTLKFKEDIDFLNQVTGKHNNGIKPVLPVSNEVERLDFFLNRYCEHPTNVPFEEFGLWYEFMKSMDILKVLTDEEKQILKNVYGNNGGKLKAAWVQKTLDGYVISGMKVSDVFKIRQRLNETQQRQY